MAESKLSPGLMNAAMAWRVKYRHTDAEGKTMQTHTLGVHQKTRGGVYPAGVRCKNMTVEVGAVGFAKEEVTHQLIAVDEFPVECIKEQGTDYTIVAEYSIQNSSGDEYLRT